MAPVIPSLFKLIGDGFDADAYAADGNHLRWMFDHRLGFPRYPFCLERRASVATDEGRHGIQVFHEVLGLRGAEASTGAEDGTPHEMLVSPDLTVRRDGSTLTVTADGVVLNGDPLILIPGTGSSPAAEASACWARLWVKLFVPFATVLAEAIYDTQGEGQIVDRQARDYRPSRLPFPVREPTAGRPLELRESEIAAVEADLHRYERIAALLAQPETDPDPPEPDSEEQRALYDRLLQLDERRFARVSSQALQDLAAALRRYRLSVADLRPGMGIGTVVQVDLRADRIDRIFVTGGDGFLMAAEWVRTEDLMQAESWEQVDCYPFPICERDYRDRAGDIDIDIGRGRIVSDVAAQQEHHEQEQRHEPRLPEEADDEHPRRGKVCVDLGQLSVGAGSNPRVEQGVSFEVSDHTGAPTPDTQIRDFGSALIGLDCGSRTEIVLPSPSGVVEVTLVHFARPAKLQAFNADGTLAAGTVMVAPPKTPETITLTGAAIHRLILDAPQDETLILDVCYEGTREPCVNFERFPVGVGPNPRTEQGIEFEVHDHSGGLTSDTRITTFGTFTGLDLGFESIVTLPAPVTSVEVRLVHFAQPADAEAFNSDGTNAGSASMSGPQTTPETLTLSGAAIDRVVIRAKGDETLLLEICTKGEPHGDPCLERAAALAELRLLDPMPHGAEPLDDPQTPPVRPPTADELRRRYLIPWVSTMGPWMQKVLADSASGTLHQSEVAIQRSLTELGQAAGEGVPGNLSGTLGKTIDIRPYGLLLAASTAFRFAKLMGLAAIDVPPTGPAAWDYRVRGRWRTVDIAAYGTKLTRDLAALTARLATATPAQRPGLQAQILDTWIEVATTNTFISFLNSGAIAGIVELWALKVGLQEGTHGLFPGPASLTATYDGLGVPRPGTPLQAVARLSWPLRQRARAPIDEDVPLGAVLARDTGGTTGVFSQVLNPVHPDFGVATPIVPAGPEGASGSAGTGEFRDRHVPDGVNLRYGVSEVDPFGRWSAFVETPFRWDNDLPPPRPTQVTAELDLAGTPPSLKLRVRFSWPTDLEPLAGHVFRVHLRRQAPPTSPPPGTHSHWGRFERQAGTMAGPFTFPATFTGSNTHDAMPVTVTSSSRSVTDPIGNTLSYQDYDLTFTGLVVTRDATDRARVWVGVSARDAGGLDSSEVGGPALAEHYLTTPPAEPIMPPDPEQATYADAQGRSSYTVHWNGQADTRYVVYRTGERELVLFLQGRGINTIAYRETDPPNLRAAALKALAPQGRDAFQPRSGLVPDPPVDSSGSPLDPINWPSLPAGPRTFTDELPGQLRTLTVFTTLGRSKSGVPGTWPSTGAGFVVVQVPHAPEPARPVVVRAAWEPPIVPPPSAPAIGGARAELLIAEPPAPPESADVDSYEVYRTLDPAKAEDYRLMRPMHPLVSPSFVTVPGVPGVKVATWADPTVQPWRTYYYRLVARAPGLGTRPRGMRSVASAAIQVDTLSSAPPAPPAGVSTARLGVILRVSFTATAPTTPAGDFRLEVIDVDGSVRTVVATTTASATRQATADQYMVELDSSLLPAGRQVVVRVVDPRGQSTESVPVLAT